MRFEFFIAARYLRAKRRQAVVGVITAISVIGVAAGVASLIIALAITNGMRRDLQERLVGSTSHVDLMRVAGDGIRDWRPLLARLRGVPHVVAAAPGLYGQVLISKGARSGGGLVKGVIPKDEKTVGDLLQSVVQGSAAALEPVAAAAPCGGGTSARNDCGGGVSREIPPIVIGQDMAESLGAKVGDGVLVTSPQGELTPLGLVPKYERFQVAGIFKSGFYQYDSSYAFLRLADAQRLFSEPDLISVISFKVDDLYHADRVGRAIEDAAGKGFQTTNWMEQNRELFRALKLEQVVTFIVLALIVCVAALNILIALTMMVMEKTRDIAVLMSFGVSGTQVRRIFLMQGLLISVIGTVLGLILGYGLSWLGGHYRFIRLDAAVYSIDYLPFAPRVLDAVIVAAVSLGVSLIATIYPSGSAAKVLPAEALRYE
ncbi:FtsX-like permease family protein [Tunturibacter empetritectus]|uniref:Lipoprotein-releasing system permease protein n=1 Tax=Tunturiibacter empetritectus TaxID=3069691 RepID=A0A7W8IG21_9BACT|nr:FtsX-like permease family protein [Edaphobacter lichenicola]MBB5315540.1 lipoprotein-releasing system permease protein [Edaphobacter lichenicola]